MRRILVIMSVAAVVAAMIAASAATIASAAQPAPRGFKNDCVSKNGVYTKDGSTQVCKWDTVLVDNRV